MVFRFSFLLLFLTTILVNVNAQSGEDIDQATVYSALSTDDVKVLNDALQVLNQQSTVRAQAYKGALLMRKAGLVKGAGKKLSAFKDGRDLLENSIHADQDNAEYRFLRLMIQENAPSILGYKDNLDEDVKLVANNFNNLDTVVQKAIKNYSQVSNLIVVK